jgi:hypothetical protein
VGGRAVEVVGEGGEDEPAAGAQRPRGWGQQVRGGG